MFVSVSSDTFVSITSKDVAVPSGMQVGDIVIGFVCADNDANTTSTDMSRLHYLFRTGTLIQSSASFLRVVTDAEPATYSFTFGISVSGVAILAAYRGVRGRDTSDVAATPSGTSHTTPTIATVETDEQIISCFVMAVVGGTTWTPPPESTERADLKQGSVSAELADDIQSVAASISRTATAGKSEVGTAHIIALFPARLGTGILVGPSGPAVQTRCRVAGY